MNLPDGYNLLSKDFSSARQTLFDEVSAETSYGSEDFEFLWNDLMDYFDNLHAVTQGISAARKALTGATLRSCKNASLRWLPWGTVLFCPASNAIVPVVPATLFALLSCGNQVVVAPSRKVLGSTKHVVEILLKRFPDWRENTVLFEGGGRQAIEHYVDGGKVKLLWFQGDSSHRQSVISQCLQAGIDCIFEGSGNCLTIVDNLSDVDRVAAVSKSILEAAQVCAGRLCTTPRLIFVHCDVLFEFKKQLKMRLSKYEQERMLAVSEYELVDLPNHLLEKEVFDDSITIISFKSLDDLMGHLAIYKYGIQICFFTDNSSEFVVEKTLGLNISRLIINVSPIFQRSILPWGGYRLSGPNPVSTLFEKSQRAILIHE